MEQLKNAATTFATEFFFAQQSVELKSGNQHPLTAQTALGLGIHHN
ncbi:hypothetical protein [Methylomonas sp. LW13]|nr:hypothetical protein [Methylomonas sp. LW13]